MGVPAGAIESEHRQLVRPLAERLVSRENERLAECIVVPAESEKRSQPFLERDETELLEPLALGSREVLVGELSVGAAPPEGERALGE